MDWKKEPQGLCDLLVGAGFNMYSKPPLVTIGDWVDGSLDSFEVPGPSLINYDRTVRALELLRLWINHPCIYCSRREGKKQQYEPGNGHSRRGETAALTGDSRRRSTKEDSYDFQSPPAHWIYIIAERELSLYACQVICTFLTSLRPKSDSIWVGLRMKSMKYDLDMLSQISR